MSSNSASYGQAYVHDANEAKGTKSARYTPNLAYGGLYKVSILYTSATNRASNVPVLLHTADGDETKTVNMKSGGGTWQSLGTHRFDPGDSGWVEIQTTGTDGYVVADAIIFQYQQNRSLNGEALLEANEETEGYDLIQADGTVYRFDDSSPHRLLSLQSPGGQELVFEHDPNGLLETVTTPAGRVLSFDYGAAPIGGKMRLQSISSQSQTLVEYAYSDGSGGPPAGRLEVAVYPEDGSSYEYTYSTLDGSYKLLERVEDQDGRVVEEHTWGYSAFPARPSVVESHDGQNNLELEYLGAGATKKTTVTRHLDAQTSESFDVFFDSAGRVRQKSGSCGSCSGSMQRDRAGNKFLETDALGRMTLSRYDNRNNKLYEAQVELEPNQPLAGTDEFDGASLDPTLWTTLASERGRSFIEQNSGSLHLGVTTATRPIKAGIVSKFRLVGDFDISLTYSGMGGAAQNNSFNFGVSSLGESQLFSTAAAFFGVEHDENDGFRLRRKPAGTTTVTIGADSGNVWLRHSVLRVVRSGSNITAYRDGTVSLGTSTQTMPSELYVYAFLNNFASPYPLLYMNVEEIRVNSGTVRGDLYEPVAGMERNWEYDNSLLPSAVTRVVEPSLYAGQQKSATYDYDDPATDAQPSVPNSEPTKRLHRVVEAGSTDANHDTTPEAISRVTAYDYYDPNDPDGLNGQLKSVDGPMEDDTLVYVYDAVGQLSTVTNSLGQTVSYAAYDLYGHATQVLDINGVQTTLSYSRRGQVLSQSFDPGGLDLQSSSTYQDDLLLSSTSPKGVVTLQSYDGYRRLQSTSRRATAEEPDLEKAVYGYNYEGLRTLEELRDPNTVRYSVTTVAGRSADPNDAQQKDFVKTEAPTGSGHWTTTWSDEAGRPVTRQDPSGHLTRYAYDERGRLSSVTEKSVSDGLGSTVDHVTSYEYDDAGNLAGVTDPQGLVTGYSYDDFGRLLKVDSPDSGLTRYG